MESEVQEYARVTEVLDYFYPPELVRYIANIGWGKSQAQLKRTGSASTRVHKLIYDQHKKGRYKLRASDSFEVKSAMQAWDFFKRDYDPIVLDMEHREYDGDLGVTGQWDMFCVIDRALDGRKVGNTLLDLKSTGAIRMKNWVQAGMYARMKQNRDGVKIDSLAILRLDRNLGEYQFEVRPFEQYYVDLFYNHLNLFRYYNQEEPKALNKEEGKAHGSNSAVTTEVNPTKEEI